MNWFQDDLYILNTLGKFNFLENKKVIKIGNVDVNILKNEVNKFICSDNVYEKNKLNGNFLCRRTVLDLLNLINEKNEVTINYIDNGIIKEISLSLIDIKKPYINELWKNSFNIGKNEITYCYNRYKPSLRTQELTDYNTLYL